LQLAIAGILGAICSCNFLPSLITSGQWICDPDNPDDVIFQASIIGGGTLNETNLISSLQSWALNTPRIEVGGMTLTVTGACSSEDCVGPTESNTTPPTPTPFGFWIYVIIAVVALIAIVAACVVIFLLVKRRQKKKLQFGSWTR